MNCINYRNFFLRKYYSIYSSDKWFYYYNITMNDNNYDKIYKNTKIFYFKK